MVTINLQNKAEELGRSSDGYFVVEARYEDSDLFRKFVHMPTGLITEDNITLQNDDRKLRVIIDEKEDGEENMYTFKVLFLIYDLENPLIIIIESPSKSNFFMYSDLMGSGKPDSVKLSEIEEYHDDLSILSALYNESFKAGTMLVYRLEMQKHYTGVEVNRDDENTEYKVYVHTPEESCKERISCVSYNDKLVLTYIDDQHETGALYHIQEKTYEKITVYNYDDRDEGDLIQFFRQGKSFSYQKTEDGKWKYRGGHKLEEDQVEPREDEETEGSIKIENSEHHLSLDKKGEGSENETEETKENDPGDEIPEFLKGSLEPTDYTEEMIRRMDETENEHGGGLPPDQQSQIEDENKSSSGLQSKEPNGKNSDKTIDEEYFEQNIRAKVLAGTIIPLIIAVSVCPAYMAYEYYLKK